LRQEKQAFLAARTPPRSARGPRGRRKVLVALRNAQVHVDEAHVIKGVDLDVARGDCWVIHGHNGSGKTTLLRTIYGDHGVAAGGSITRDGIIPGVPLETFKLRTAYVAPHLQTWHQPKMPVLEVVASGRYASIGLNDSLTPGDRRHA
jgi:ABC-type molybdenum transport system ATPase subunit/photorepair protein PhrA